MYYRRSIKGPTRKSRGTRFIFDGDAKLPSDFDDFLQNEDNESFLNQYLSGIPVAIPVTAGNRGFAGIPVPAKFHFFAGIPYRDFTLNLVIKICQKFKIFQQKFDKKHVKYNTDLKLKVVIFFTQ